MPVFIIAVPSQQVRGWVQTVLSRMPGLPADMSVVVGQTRQVLRQARAAMVASGTATLEAALMQCPMVVIYKVAFLTYLIGRIVIKVPYLGMVNIVAGTSLCPEFIQYNARPGAIASAMKPLIQESVERKRVITGFQQVANALGTGDCENQAADIVLKELET